MQRLRTWFNHAVLILGASVLLAGGGLAISAPVYAETAAPNYACGTYGGNAYSSCDTTISSSTGTTTTPTDTTQTPGTTTTGTTGSTAQGSGEQTKPTTHWYVRWGWFGLFFVIFLLGIGLLLLLLGKRRKEEDNIQPPPPTIIG